MELGNLIEEPLDCKSIRWDIPNASSLPHWVNSVVQSPPFSFAGATWILEMYPSGETKENSKGYIGLYVKRLNSQISEHHISYSLSFLTRKGKTYESVPFNFVFNSEDTEFGEALFQLRSKLFSNRNLLLPNDVLTVMCQLQTEKIALIDKYSQVEPAVPLTEFSREASVQVSLISDSKDCSREASVQVSLSSDSKEFAGVTCIQESSTSACKGCDCASQNPVPQHDTKLHQDFKALFRDQRECDVTIKVKGREFPAHKAILMARSPVFASTFTSDMREKATGVLDIEDCEPASFADFLCFLYSGHVDNLSTENVFSLFTAADKYDVEDLRSECLDFMRKNLSSDTFCDTIALALQHSEKELIQLAVDFFAENYQEVIVTVKWQSFLLENPIQGNEIMIKALVKNKK